MSRGTLARFELAELLARRTTSKRSYLQFLNEPTLSMGIYHLPKNGVDKQSPHEEDEVYSVISGKAVLEVDEERTPVGPGDVCFVAAHARHRFVEIEEDLTLLVFFSKAKPARP
ncbi:MAG: cupin domain-containing protein [Phycisphaerales bacterium]|nr:cupin domain-containing protein [Phycisphaerae bacterium]NNF42773.1 cupin domain-containing protein [Phycisphaerales bacterium]NNM26106.1 cupin domain-containing protein [Phycisphaerales bacterium]